MVRHLQVPDDFIAPPLHTAKKQISLPKDWSTQKADPRIQMLELSPPTSLLNAKVSCGCGSKMMRTPVAETTTANYTFSHLQQQCNFVSTKKAGCPSSFAQESVLDANCQFILRVAASLAMNHEAENWRAAMLQIC